MHFEISHKLFYLCPLKYTLSCAIVGWIYIHDLFYISYICLHFGGKLEYSISSEALFIYFMYFSTWNQVNLRSREWQNDWTTRSLCLVHGDTTILKAPYKDGANALMGSAQSESLLLLLEYCGGREKNLTQVCCYNTYTTHIFGLLFCHAVLKQQEQ